MIDASVVLFGQMFPLVANKHRLKVRGGSTDVLEVYQRKLMFLIVMRFVLFTDEGSFEVIFFYCFM